MDRSDRRDGLVAGLASYVAWGFFPLYFVLLRGVDPAEILAHRVVWAVLALLGVVAVRREWAALRRVLEDRRAVARLALASVFIGAVWFVYGYGALTGRAVDVALGYFICPLVTVLLAVAVQGERLRPAQWASAAVGGSAVVVVTAGHGRFPWISVVVALAFGLYSLVKNRVGRDVTATVGLTVESVLLVPLSVAVAAWLYAAGRATFAVGGLGATDLWLVLSGPITVLPLLLFAAAAGRLALSMLGNLQYLNPVLQLLAGVLVLREDMPAARWAGFALVWVALGILVVDAARERRRSGRATPLDDAPAREAPASRPAA